MNGSFNEDMVARGYRTLGACETTFLVPDIVVTESIGRAIGIYHTVGGIYVVHIPKRTYQHSSCQQLSSQMELEARTEEEVRFDPACLVHPRRCAIHECPDLILAALPCARVAKVLIKGRSALMVLSPELQKCRRERHT